MLCFVKFKNQFGVDTIIPACPVAETFANIAGTKTLTKPAIEYIKSLGYRVEVVQQVRTI